MGYYDYYGWKPYVSVAERRRKAERAMRKLAKKGRTLSPVKIDGRAIARTFWGKAWCDNLERYSDFSNRLPRGRTYARNGSVLDLQIMPGEVDAMVSGSDLYRVTVKVAVLPKARWMSLCGDCAGAIDSLVELLQGRFSKGVMERICRQKSGLFPQPSEIRFSCSCPDWASMCKHVAAVLYGIGARLDERPELLFKLRKVDERDLIVRAGKELPLAKKDPAQEKVLAGGDLSELFGLDLGAGNAEIAAEVVPAPKKTVKLRSEQTPAQTPGKAAARKTPPETKKKPPKDRARPATRKKKGKTMNGRKREK